MRAVYAMSNGGVDMLQVGDVATPDPSGGEIRVRVHASAVNHADVKVLRGNRLLHKKAFPLVVGYDFSGVVDALGSGVRDLHVGDHVYGHLRYASSNDQGAFAEYLESISTREGKWPIVSCDH